MVPERMSGYIEVFGATMTIWMSCMSGIIQLCWGFANIAAACILNPVACMCIVFGIVLLVTVGKALICRLFCSSKAGGEVQIMLQAYQAGLQAAATVSVVAPPRRQARNRGNSFW